VELAGPLQECKLGLRRLAGRSSRQCRHLAGRCNRLHAPLNAKLM
jgi:hypothetical protein